MSRHELKSRDKVTQKISRDGLIEVNETKGDINRISRREADFSLGGDSPERENLSRHERKPAHAAPKRQKNMFSHNTDAGAAYAAHTDKPQELADLGIIGDTYKPEYDAVFSDNKQPQSPEPLNAQYHAPAAHKHERLVTERHTDEPKPALYTHEQPHTSLQTENHDNLQFAHDNSAQAHERQSDIGNARKNTRNREHRFSRLQTEAAVTHGGSAQTRDMPPNVIGGDIIEQNHEQPHTALQTQNPDKLQFIRDEPAQIHSVPVRESLRDDSVTMRTEPVATSIKHKQYTTFPETGAQAALRFNRTKLAPISDKPTDTSNILAKPEHEYFHANTSPQPEIPDSPRLKQESEHDFLPQPEAYKKLRFISENTAPESAFSTESDVKLNRDSLQHTKPQPDSSAKLQSAPKKSKPEASQNAAHVTGVKSDKKDKQTASAGTKPAKSNKKTDKPPDIASGKTGAHVKTQPQHLKGNSPFRPVKTGVNTVMAYGHSKAFQAEDENAGTQAAHRAELTAETGIRTALRFNKAVTQHKATKLEQAAAKKTGKLSHQRSAQSPKQKGKPIKNAMQKRKIKRQYAQLARQKHKAAKAIRNANLLVTNAKKVLTGIIRRHPAAVAVTLLIMLTVTVLISLFGLASGIAGSGLNGIFVGAYLAEEAEIEAAEIAYTEWEIDLREEIENVESDYPGYDEYRFDIGDIGHSPHELMAYLTTEYLDYKFSDIAGELQNIFDSQYILTITEIVETRYYYDEDEDEWVPYDWYVLNTVLESKPLAEVLNGRMNVDRQLHYTALMDTKGGRQYAGSPFAYDWLPYVTCNYGWRADPFTGEKSFHTGIDIGAPMGTQIIAAHDGVVTSVVYGSTGYGYQTMIAGENGLSTRYAHCSALLVSVGQKVKAGDVVALVGSTGWSTGPHLHFEVIKDGEYLNPAYFADSEE